MKKLTRQEMIDAYKLQDQIWNEAIEAAASVIDQLNKDGPYQAIGGANEIRKLKR